MYETYTFFLLQLLTFSSSSHSHAGGSAEVGAAGLGGWVSTLQEGAGDVCGAAAGATLPPSLQDQHRTRGAAAVSSLLLQGTI